MKRFILCAVFLFACSLAAKGQKEPSDQRAAEDYIRKCEAEWAESVASGDVTALERILADDFVGVDTKGKAYDKAKEIANTREGPKHFTSNHLDEVKIRFYSKTAVAQGSESWVKQNGEHGRFVWTDTWILRDGKWQIVAAEDLSAPPLEEPKR